VKGEQDLNLFGAKGPRLCVVGKNEDGGVTSLAMKTKPAKRIQDARRNRLTGLRSLSFKNGAIKPGRLAFQVNQRSANNPVNSLRHFDKMLPLSIYSLSFCICFNSSSLLLSKFEKKYMKLVLPENRFRFSYPRGCTVSTSIWTFCNT